MQSITINKVLKLTTFFAIENCNDVNVVTEGGAENIFWSIGSCMESNRYQDYQNYTEKCCLSPGEHIALCRDFTMDQQGDVGKGWKGAHLKVAGNTICKSFTRGPIKLEIFIIGENIVYRYFVVTYSIFLIFNPFNALRFC